MPEDEDDIFAQAKWIIDEEESAPLSNAFEGVEGEDEGLSAPPAGEPSGGVSYAGEGIGDKELKAMIKTLREQIDREVNKTGGRQTVRVQTLQADLDALLAMIDMAPGERVPPLSPEMRAMLEDVTDGKESPNTVSAGTIQESRAYVLARAIRHFDGAAADRTRDKKSREDAAQQATILRGVMSRMYGNEKIARQKEVDASLREYGSDPDVVFSSVPEKVKTWLKSYVDSGDASDLKYGMEYMSGWSKRERMKEAESRATTRKQEISQMKEREAGLLISQGRYEEAAGFIEESPEDFAPAAHRTLLAAAYRGMEESEQDRKAMLVEQARAKIALAGDDPEAIRSAAAEGAELIGPLEAAKAESRATSLTEKARERMEKRESDLRAEAEDRRRYEEGLTVQAARLSESRRQFDERMTVQAAERAAAERARREAGLIPAANLAVESYMLPYEEATRRSAARRRRR